MGAAGSLDASALGALSSDEIAAAAEDVQGHVTRLEAENAALAQQKLQAEVSTRKIYTLPHVVMQCETLRVWL